MEKASHLKLITMSLLQTCGYVSEQMHTKVTIDVNKFMEAFSIEVPGGRLHPPSWTRWQGDKVAITQSLAIPPSPQIGESSTLPEIFSMDDYRQCHQAEALRWIDLQERRSSIIPQLQPTTPEEYERLRDAIKAETGPFRRKSKKPTGTNQTFHINRPIISALHSQQTNYS